MAENQEAATLEKTTLEDEQRKAVAERAETGTTWVPKHFVYVSGGGGGGGDVIMLMKSWCKRL